MMSNCIIFRIKAKHACLVNKNNKVTLSPVEGAKVTLNGNVIQEGKELHHNDR